MAPNRSLEEKADFYVTQGCFEAFLNHPPTYVRTFSLHKLRENCHFLDHPPTPISLRNIKMAPYINPKCPSFFIKRMFFKFSLFIKNLNFFSENWLYLFSCLWFGALNKIQQNFWLWPHCAVQRIERKLKLELELQFRLQHFECTNLVKLREWCCLVTWNLVLKFSILKMVNF